MITYNIQKHFISNNKISFSQLIKNFKQKQLLKLVQNNFCTEKKSEQSEQSINYEKRICNSRRIKK